MSFTEFASVSKDKDRGITPRGGPYEFWTDEGAHIYLHDTDFRRLTYEPGSPPTLELQFLYDPQWTPPELAKTPVVAFRFEDVRITEWKEDQEGHDCADANPEVSRGQVDQFDWDGTDLFTLGTFALRLLFQARRAEVSVRPQ